MSDPVADLAELALALIQRAVRDLQSHGKYARLAWAWLMLPDTDADGAEIGWDLDDACRVLGADPACLRRALVARGYQFPPLPNVRGAARPTRGRRACAGLVHCQRCGVPVPTPDRRITRTCAACGTRLRPYYLRRHGLLSAEFRTTKPPRVPHAVAALTLLLHRGPLPGCYLHEQLMRAGFSAKTRQGAREFMRPIIARSRDGYTVWALRPA
jgi:hypothetical protein